MHPPSQSSRRALAGASLALALLAPWPSAAQSPVAAMRQQVDAEIATLQAHASQRAVVDPARLADLPPPVRRYFAYTGADSAPPTRLARYRFEGAVRIPLTGDRAHVANATPWLSATGQQVMGLSALGLDYVWDSQWQSPAGTIAVRDASLAGKTHIWALRADGRVMMDERDESIDRTYMVRFFAEATQAPAMLLPSPHLRWEPLSDTAARAVLRHGPTEARMECHFEPSGALSRCESDDRLLRYSGDVPERWIAARWIMTRTDYQPMAGLRLPTRMGVRWRLAGGEEFEQVRARITEVQLAPGPAQP